MTSRVPMVSLERARELGEAMGMPAPRTQSAAFRVVANNPGVARVAFGQLMPQPASLISRHGWILGVYVHVDVEHSRNRYLAHG